MEYTINKLAQMAGISTRTLRYYDECGLLAPHHINSSGYRIYGQAEVNMLQQILFYRELGMSLDNIKTTLSAPDFEHLNALGKHLQVLSVKRNQIDTLIQNVEKSIQAMKGEIEMSDKKKFEGFKQKIIDENEEKYGTEIRTKYGDDVIDASNARLKSMSYESFNEVFSPKLSDALKVAFEQGDPAGELAQKACDMHKEWLCFFWPEDTYTKEMHLGLGEMYVSDERFTAYYDKIVPGLSNFLLEALKVYCHTV